MCTTFNLKVNMAGRFDNYKTGKFEVTQNEIYQRIYEEYGDMGPITSIIANLFLRFYLVFNLYSTKSASRI